MKLSLLGLMFLLVFFPILANSQEAPIVPEKTKTLKQKKAKKINRAAPDTQNLTHNHESSSVTVVHEERILSEKEESEAKWVFYFAAWKMIHSDGVNEVCTDEGVPLETYVKTFEELNIKGIKRMNRYLNSLPDDELVAFKNEMNEAKDNSKIKIKRDFEEIEEANKMPMVMICRKFNKNANGLIIQNNRVRDKIISKMMEK